MIEACSSQMFVTRKQESLTTVKLELQDRRVTGDTMIVPIRCMSCGKPVAQLWKAYKDRVAKGESRKEVMDDLGLERYCCRSTFMGTVELLETAAQFKKF